MKALPEFNVELVEFPQTRVAVMEHRSDPGRIGNTIRQFIEWRKLNRLPPAKSNTFNLLYDDLHSTPADEFRFDLCCAVVTEIAANEYGVVNKIIPGGRCARVRYVGSDDSLDVVIGFLYSQWLPESGHEVRDFPVFLQRVLFYPEVPENEQVIDIYLPLK